MRKIFPVFILLTVILPAASLLTGISASAEQGTVHAVLFWMEGCPHCHYVLEEVLPPLQAKYGEQLKIFLIEVRTTEELERLYQIGDYFGLAREQMGVPFLLIGEHVLIGSVQIPAELPGLIAAYLASGGVEYPDVPLLTDLLPSGGAAEEQAPKPVTSVAEAVISTRPDGFSLAIGVMVFMGAALLYSIVAFLRGRSLFPFLPSNLAEIAFIVLILAGSGVAGYLAYVETQMIFAVCGPIGDCNAVQSSPYARLFGVLPVGILGLLGYLALMAVRLAYKYLPQFRRLLVISLMGLSGFAVVFSIYLTYLEPFVIKAVCLWCLTSAVIVTLLMLLCLDLALQTFPLLREAKR